MEFGADETGVTMWPSYLAPDYSDFASLSFSGSFVDESNTLAKVESKQNATLVAVHVRRNSLIEYVGPSHPRSCVVCSL